LIRIPEIISWSTSGAIASPNSLIISPSISAITKFDAGPAKATIPSPKRRFLKLYGLIGTGLAHPSITPPGNKAHRRGTAIEPIGSMCFIGFKVILPSSFAVGSPWYKAAIPWATSWITIEKTNIAMENIIGVIIDIAKCSIYDNMSPSMAKVCAVTKRSSIVGGGYSNRTRATQFNPTGIVRKYANLQTKKIYIPEIKKSVRLTLSTRALKTIQKNGAYATLKKAGVIK